MMKKQRKTPAIIKPVIDENVALQFASAESVPAPKSSADTSAAVASKRPAAKKIPANAVEKDMRRNSFAISKTLYNKIAKEAARKNRTVEEHLKKHLTKRYEK